MKHIKINGVAYEAVQATEEEILNNNLIIEPGEPCGRQECRYGYIWVYIDDLDIGGCKWYKTNAQCNE
ncbi:hypothetical protein IM792_06165 [Mucilaginibacter sp. JRF]|uniref:hypothetical protein n=1 Tax=Mucilaginibacter sp. JRF TaxID=2780088 RepID=UPI00187F547F|nr:hypothetical protein [Mucilaginibacter sp. JRF]MBE9584028.1 hypothetical protein [Mucilaginibacter sp. JRF]